MDGPLLMTSIYRLDRDQGARRSNAPNDDDYYNFQVHVLFDDAMERTNDGKEIKTNKWVHQLCDLIPLAAKYIIINNNTVIKFYFDFLVYHKLKHFDLVYLEHLQVS